MATVGQKKANKSKTGTYTSSSGRVYTSSKAKSNSGNSGSSGGSSSSSGFPMASAAVRASALAEANAVERRMGSRLTTAAEAESRRVAAGKEIQRQRAIDPTYATAISPYEKSNVSINSQNLGAEPYNIPQPPAIPDYSQTVNGALGTVPTVPEVPTEQSVVESQKQNFQSMIDSLQKPTDTASIYSKLEKQNKIRQKEQAVSNYQSQLNNIVAARDAQVLGLEGQGRGQTAGFIGGEQARINREAAIQALPIQAQLSAAQGDLELAKSHVDKMFQIYATDAENKVNFYNNLVKMTYEFQDKQNQRKLDAISKQKEFEQKILMSNMDAQQKYMNTALENGQIGAFNALSSIQPPTDINSPTFKQDMDRYNEKVNAAAAKYAVGNETVSIPNQYSGIINTIIGSGKFTKQQIFSITNAINNGDNPVSVIKNQAKSLLTGTSQTKLENAEAVQSAMNDLKDSLNSFYAAGGDTGYIKGTFEKVVNNLGQVKDPQLAQLAVEVQSQLQTYRNAISGTAYSDQEGKDIASVFPGINKNKVLNDSIFAGRDKALQGQIDGIYKSVLGSQYDLLKQTNEINSVDTTIDDSNKYRELYGY